MSIQILSAIIALLQIKGLPALNASDPPPLPMQDKPVADILFHAGPNRIPVGDEKFMMVATPLGENGHRLADGQRVQFIIHYPDRVVHYQAKTKYGLAVLSLPIGTNAGEITTTAQIGNNVATPIIIRARTARLTSPTYKIHCDMKNYCQFKTGPIMDRYGNNIEDGQTAQFSLLHQEKLVSEFSDQTANAIVQTEFSLSGNISDYTLHFSLRNIEITAPLLPMDSKIKGGI
ncbi:MAG: hypothetical protein ACWA5L_07370 [bacterium]